VKKGKIRDAVKEKAASLSAISKKISPRFDKEDIHTFRVTVKTLRSFLRLLRSAPHSGELKMTRKFKRIYHMAGAIRDVQLEIEQIANEHETLPAYMDHLLKQLDAQKKEWDRHYSKKDTNKQLRRLAADNYRPIDRDAIANFFNTQLLIIETLINMPSLTDDQLHSIRKRVKDILYIAKFLSKKSWERAYKEVTGIAQKDLEQLADDIGKYNDQRVLLGHLNSFTAAINGEQDIIKTLSGEKAAMLQTQKQEIIATVKRLLYPAQNNETTPGSVSLDHTG
jgi:CHAD domain-containing protein